jgi:DNA-binding response OmpR family regulator
LAFNLQNSGYDVDISGTGEEALSVLADRNYDLVLLDVMLPGIDGLEVARRLRKGGDLTPILMLTARNQTLDAIAGLDAGADDYIAKPFDLDELLARIRGFLRRQVWSRSTGTEPDTLAYGAWNIDFGSYCAKNSEGTEVKLTAKEVAILKLFADRPGDVISRETFLNEVWGLPGHLETRTVDNFMRKLRQTFEEDASAPRHIVSVRGAGYRFVP